MAQWQNCLEKMFKKHRITCWMRHFVPLSVSLWNDLSDPVFDGVELAGFKSRVNASCWHDLLFLWCLLLFYLLLLLPSMGWLCGVGVFGPIECSHSLLALHSGLQIIIIIIIIIIISSVSTDGYVWEYVICIGVIIETLKKINRSPLSLLGKWVNYTQFKPDIDNIHSVMT